MISIAAKRHLTYYLFPIPYYFGALQNIFCNALFYTDTADETCSCHEITTASSKPHNGMGGGQGNLAPPVQGAVSEADWGLFPGYYCRRRKIKPPALRATEGELAGGQEKPLWSALEKGVKGAAQKKLLCERARRVKKICRWHIFSQSGEQAMLATRAEGCHGFAVTEGLLQAVAVFAGNATNACADGETMIG